MPVKGGPDDVCFRRSSSHLDVADLFFSTLSLSLFVLPQNSSLSRSPVKNRATSVSMEDPNPKAAAFAAAVSESNEVTPPATPSLAGGPGLPTSDAVAAAGADAPSAAPVDVAALMEEAFRGSPRRKSHPRSSSSSSNGGGNGTGGSSEDGSLSPPSGRAAGASAAKRRLEFPDGGDGGGAGNGSN